MPSPLQANRLYVYGWLGDIHDQDPRWLQSDNGGQTWSETEISDKDLVLDTQDTDLLYRIAWKDYIGLYEIALNGSRSEDGGAQWVAWSQQPCSWELEPIEPVVLQLMAHPYQTRILFLRCNQGLFRSDNGGDGWTQLSSTPGQLLAPDYGTQGRILWAKDDGLWASKDNGESWQLIMPEYEPSVAAPQVPLFLPSIITKQP